MYANSGTPTADGRLETFIEKETDSFRQDSPDIRVTRGNPLITADGSRAEIRYLSGDTFGNSEAVAYIKAGKTVAMLVLTSKTRTAYETGLIAFTSLVKSYAFITDTPEDASEVPELIRQIAIDETSTPVGANYDRTFTQFFAAHHASEMQECFRTTQKAESRSFDLLVRIGENGEILKTVVTPTTNIAQCLARAVQQGHAAPKPPRAGHWVRVGMTITP